MSCLDSLLSRLLQPEAVSSSVLDTFPYLKSLADLDPEPAGEQVAAPLGRGGSVRLEPGVYEFEVQSFCLDAGRYAPGREARYLLAPMKGGRARTVRAVLQGACSHPEVGQEDVQSLIWAVVSGTRYRSLPDHLRAAAERLLPEREVLLLGKSYWYAVPAPLRHLLLDAVKSVLPPYLLEAARRLQQFRERIADAAATYRDLERMAIRPGSPPPSPAEEGAKTKARGGSGGGWSLVGGPIMRALPEGYTRTRLQVYVPERSALRVGRDHLGRVAQVEVPGEPAVEITYADVHPDLTLRAGVALKVWRFEKLRVLASDGVDADGEATELDITGWVPQAPEELARLDEAVEMDLSERILSARDIIEDGITLRRLSGLGRPAGRAAGGLATADRGSREPGPESSDPIADITDMGHYLRAVEAILKDLRGGVKFDEKVKWLTEHFRRLRRAYASALARLAGQVQEAERDLDFSCPTELVAVSADPREQRLGFRCPF